MSEHIIKTEYLSEEQREALGKLCGKCNRHDGTSYSADDEPDICFLMYEEDELTAALLVYRMGDTFRSYELDEIAAFTLPEKRGCGRFSALLREAGPLLRPALRFSVYENAPAMGVLRALGAEKKNDELLMSAALCSAGADHVTYADCTVTEETFSTGKAELYYSCEDGTVYFFAVSAYRRGRGYGTDLMKKALAYFGNLGMHSALLEVSSDNIPAVRLYRSCGFKELVSLGQWYLVKK